LGDHYLAQTGYQSQQTNSPRNPDRPYNLWESVDDNPGARGVFGSRAREHSWQLEVNKHLDKAALASLGLLGAALLVAGRALSRQQ
jgi:hypothetical protein